MKRLKLFLTSIFFILAVSGCKSKPETASFVNPLDLLDNNSSFYLRIPTSVDSDTVQRMLQANVRNLSEKDAKAVAERIDTLYIGLNKHKKYTEYQISAGCDIPKMAVNSAFSKKNGWTRDELLMESKNGSSVSYSIYNNSNLLASFPSTSVACMGRNVPSMVEKFHYLAEEICSPEDIPLNPVIHDWLDYEQGIHDNQIRFFASKPQSFLTILTGANLNFRLVYVRGSLENDPKCDDQFLMTIEFEFREAKLLPAAKAMLSVAFGLTNSEVSVDSDTHLRISNIKIKKSKLYEIFVI